MILKAKSISGTRMFIDTNAAVFLINTYLKTRFMGYIKEPKGVYLIIPPSKLTQKEANEISDFIQKDKLRNKNAKAKMSVKALEIIKKYDADHS